MKNACLALALAAFAAIAPAQTRRPVQGAVENAVLQMERDILDAILRKDLARLEKMVAQNFYFVAPDGGVQNRLQWFADLKTGALRIEASKNDQMQVRVYGNAAVAVYRSTDRGTYKGHDISGQYRWSDFFVSQNGRWQLVSTQGTAIPAAASAPAASPKASPPTAPAKK